MRIPPHLRKLFIKTAIKNGLKLLCYDLETSHIIVRTHYIGNKVSINHKQIKKGKQIICITHMDAKDKKAKCLKWDKLGNEKFDDSKIIQQFGEILSEADITLTQNGDKFDWPTMNERAKAMHLNILSQKPSLDILKLSRKSFAAASHKLDYRSHQQGLGGKIHMVDQDWVDVEENGVPVDKKMGPYGCKDTEDTLKLLWRELSYYKDLPTAVERVIFKYLPKDFLHKHLSDKTIRCEDCRARHRCCTDIKVTSSGIAKCLNCKKKWDV